MSFHDAESFLLFYFLTEGLQRSVYFTLEYKISYNLLTDIWWRKHKKVYLSHGGQCNTSHRFYTLTQKLGDIKPQELISHEVE